MAQKVWFVAALLAFLPIMVAESQARSLVWARASDALTLDPHAINEGPTHTLNHQIYEPLIVRDTRGRLHPALALRWFVGDDPRIWTFQLRPDVKFHDGSPVTVEDVVFSLNRALSPTSDVRGRLEGVETIARIDGQTLSITTKGRNPLLPMQLTDIMIMNEAWAKSHGLEVPQPYKPDGTGRAQTIANGTGPFMLTSRTPGTETRLRRNAAYWSPLPAIEEIVYRVIPNSAERVQNLIEGKIDFVQDVPVARINELRATPGITLRSGPENRVIFLGANVTPTRRTGEEPDQPNPLANQSVREAINISIDRRKIQKDVMNGQSIPTAVVAPPTINGYPQRFDHVRPVDLDKARELLEGAGHPKGFDIPLDCPQGRYVNDAGICKAIAGQLAEIGLRITPVLRPKTEHFARVRGQKSDFYLLGWGVPTFDSEYVFRHLFRSVPAGQSGWNGTGYANDKIDGLIDSIAVETDLVKRNQTIAEIWWRVHAERVYIPIHVQTLTYAMRTGLEIDVDVSDAPKLKFARFANPAPANPN